MSSSCDRGSVRTFVCDLMVPCVASLAALTLLLLTSATCLLMARLHLAVWLSPLFPIAPALAPPVLSLVWNLAVDAEEQEMLLALGAVDSAVGVIADWPDNLSIQHAASGMLGMMAYRHDGAQRAMVEQGVVPLLLSAMLRFPTQEHLQASLCVALWNLGANFTTGDEIAGRGGVNLIVSALRTFPDDVDIQRNCNGALWSLAANNSTRGEVSEAGGEELALGAMERFRGDSSVQWAGLGVIGMLAADATIRENMDASIVVPVFVRSLQHHQDTQTVTNACLFLHNLAISEAHRIALVQEKRALTFIHGAARILETYDATLYSTCCAALAVVTQLSQPCMGEILFPPTSPISSPALDLNTMCERPSLLTPTHPVTPLFPQ